MAKETMEATVKTISRKREKMIKTVMVAPIEVMKRRHLLIRRPTIPRMNNNNSTSHCIRKEKPTERLTRTH